MIGYEIKLPKPKSKSHIEIHVPCCLHKGHKNHDTKLAARMRNMILRRKHAYVMNLGDDIENAIPGSEKHNEMVHDSIMPVERQITEAKEFWYPLAKEGKILLTHDSNHWWRSEAKTGISLAADLWRYLYDNSPKRRKPIWGRWMALGVIRIGKLVYRIHSWHGAGGGTTPEGALRRCRSQVGPHLAHIYLMGHLHKVISYDEPYREYDLEQFRVVERRRIYCVTGSFMKWDNGYAERKGLPLAHRGWAVLRLGTREWDAQALPSWQLVAG